MKDRSPAPTGLPHNYTEPNLSSIVRLVPTYKRHDDPNVNRFRFARWTDELASFVQSRAA